MRDLDDNRPRKRGTAQVLGPHGTRSSRHGVIADECRHARRHQRVEGEVAVNSLIGRSTPAGGTVVWTARRRPEGRRTGSQGPALGGIRRAIRYTSPQSPRPRQRGRGLGRSSRIISTMVPNELPLLVGAGWWRTEVEPGRRSRLHVVDGKTVRTVGSGSGLIPREQVRISAGRDSRTFEAAPRRAGRATRISPRQPQAAIRCDGPVPPRPVQTPMVDVVAAETERRLVNDSEETPQFRRHPHDRYSQSRRSKTLPPPPRAAR